MKKILKKNQIAITSLAIMIAVAGYLNFTKSDVPTVTSYDETDEALYIGNVSCGSGFNECVTVPVKYILSGDEERIRAVVKRYKDVVYEYLKRTLYYMPIYE